MFTIRLWLFDALMKLAGWVEPAYRWRHEVTEDGLYTFWRERE